MESQHAKIATDIVAAGTLTAAIAGWLPLIAAFLSSIWLVMQMVIHWDAFTAALKKKAKEWFE